MLVPEHAQYDHIHHTLDNLLYSRPSTSEDDFPVLALESYHSPDGEL